MSRARKITVELTEAQFMALSGAVARGQYDVECEMEDEGMADARREHATAERAWDRIADAWYAPRRGARR